MLFRMEHRLKLSEVKEKQSPFINSQINATQSFSSSIDKSQIETIMLSGSVARGDYFAGSMGGMIDLIVLKTPHSSVTADALFGPNEEPTIPYHCIRREGIWYSILLLGFFTVEDFCKLPEARKYSLFESIVLYERSNLYSKLEPVLRKAAETEWKELFQSSFFDLNYYLSEYKVDRWKRRGEVGQLRLNLNEAVKCGIKCVYYLNDQYAPANDRILYYSYELARQPNDYEEIMYGLVTQKTDSIAEYEQLEMTFREKVVEFLHESGQKKFGLT